MPVTQELLTQIKDYESQGYSPDEIVKGISASPKYKDVASQINFYQTKGYTTDEMLGGIKASPTASQPESPFLNRSRVSDEGIQRGTHPLESIWQGSKSGLKEFAQPVVESTALVGGAMAGAPLGPLGSVAGAGLLYSAAEQAFNEKKRGNFTEASKDVLTGAGMEAGGQIIGAMIPPTLKAAGWLWGNLPSTSTKALEKEAGQILIKNTSNGPIYAKNAQEAAQIEEKIQGLKFTRGQSTADPLAIAKERSLFATTEGGKSALKENEAQANEAIRQYYEKGLKGETADTLNTIKRGQTGIEQMKAASEGQATDEAERLSQGANPQVTGQTIFGELQGGKEAARATKNALYGDLPNVPVSTSDNIVKEIRKLSQPYGAFENVGGAGGNLPQAFHDVENILQGEGSANIGFQDMQSLKARLNNDIRMERSAQSPNDYKVKRLVELKDFVVKEMNKLGDSKKYGPIAEQFKQAEKFYKEGYLPYKQGSIGEVLRPSSQGDLRVDSSKIIDKFFNTSKLDDADAFIKMMGSNANARQAVKDYTSQRLLSEATDPLTGNISSKKLAGWLFKNKLVLQKFGLQDEFKTIVKAQKQVDAWQAVSDRFEKSVAAKMISNDASGITFEQGISQAMQSPQKIRQMMDMVKGDANGEAGLRKGVGDFILNQSRTTAEDIKSNPLVSTAKITQLMRRYEPSLKELFKDNPEELDTLKTVNRAYEILARTQRPTLSGSDTVEKLMPILQASGSAAERIPVAGQAIGMIRTVAKLFRPYSQEKINQFLVRASFDPSYAESLMKVSKGNTKGIEPLIRKQMLTLGIYSLERDKGANQ